MVPVDDVPDLQLLQAPEGDILAPGGAHQLPEEVSLPDHAHIAPIPPDDRDSAVAVVAELLQPLAEGTVLIEIGNVALWREKVCDVHGIPLLPNVDDAAGSGGAFMILRTEQSRAPCKPRLARPAGFVPAQGLCPISRKNPVSSIAVARRANGSPHCSNGWIP